MWIFSKDSDANVFVKLLHLLRKTIVVPQGPVLAGGGPLFVPLGPGWGVASLHDGLSTSHLKLRNEINDLWLSGF